MSLFGKVKKKTVDAGKKGWELGGKGARKGVDLGKKAGKKGVQLGKKGAKKTKQAVK